jgi:hypothetical protein
MRNHMAAGWFYSLPQIARYFATRLSSLVPPKVTATQGHTEEMGLTEA